MLEARINSPYFKVLGARVNAVQIPDVIAQMERWISSRDASHSIAVANVHVVMEAKHDVSFRKVLDAADLTVPDGMPLVWCGRLRGHNLRRRVYGPDIALGFFRETEGKGYTHFFFGSAPGVPEKLAEEMKKSFPNLKVVGTYSPPFRPPTKEEDAEVVEMINRADPDVLWVGLGCPKQERWMYDHRKCLRAPVMVGVGAAFDFFTGRVRQAPVLMRDHGLEWLFRLWQEPKRLWHRYVVFNTQFIFYSCLEASGLKHFE
jgi:N-acetylglucosaminyldiphosphoundecaprenol N-acetyl-beta-D-mannosaminyltransferase